MTNLLSVRIKYSVIWGEVLISESIRMLDAPMNHGLGLEDKNKYFSTDKGSRDLRSYAHPKP